MTLATTDLAFHGMSTPKFYPDVRISQAEYTGARERLAKFEFQTYIPEIGSANVVSRKCFKSISF